MGRNKYLNLYVKYTRIIIMVIIIDGLSCITINKKELGTKRKKKFSFLFQMWYCVYTVKWVIKGIFPDVEKRALSKF